MDAFASDMPWVGSNPAGYCDWVSCWGPDGVGRLGAFDAGRDMTLTGCGAVVENLRLRTGEPVHWFGGSDGRHPTRVVAACGTFRGRINVEELWCITDSCISVRDINLRIKGKKYAQAISKSISFCTVWKIHTPLILNAKHVTSRIENRDEYMRVFCYLIYLLTFALWITISCLVIIITHLIHAGKCL